MSFTLAWLLVFLMVLYMTRVKETAEKSTEELFNLRWSEDMNDLELLLSDANFAENDDEDTQFHELMMDAYEKDVVLTRILADLFDDYQIELEFDRDHPHDPTQIFW